MIALRWNIAQTFERLWWMNYLSGKHKPNYLDWKKNYWQGLLHQVFELIDDRSAAESFDNHSLQILDAGCGPSGIFMNLQRHNVDALDPLANHYLEKHQLIERRQFPKVNFISGRLEDFTFNEKYDWIFCMNCINHVKDIELCLKNIFNALKNNGFLVLTVDAHRYTIAKSLLKLIPADILHPYQLSHGDYVRLIENHFIDGTIRKSRIKSGVLFNHDLLAIRKEI